MHCNAILTPMSRGPLAAKPSDGAGRQRWLAYGIARFERHATRSFECHATRSFECHATDSPSKALITVMGGGPAVGWQMKLVLLGLARAQTLPGPQQTDVDGSQC